MADEVPEFLYRFRPVRWLLGEEGKPGELEGLYIYFASRSELNDPMEGHKELFWSGDVVVWRNLFRHYLLCLFYRISQYMDGVISDSEFPIRVSFTGQPAGVLDIVECVSKEFLSNKNVQMHIELLALNERKVNLGELICHFRVVHMLALSLYAREMHRVGVLSGEWKAAKFGGDATITSTNFLEALKSALDNPRSDGVQFSEIMTASNLLFSQSTLQTQYRGWKTGARDHWFNVAISFPDEYCLKLESLNFPEWYVACFMTGCGDSSIWGSYGNNHSAVCLKFKTTIIEGRPTIPITSPSGIGGSRDNIRVSWSKRNMSFDKVIYGSGFAEVDFFRSLGATPMEELYSTWYMDGEGKISSCGEHVVEGKDEWRTNYWGSFKRSSTVKLEDWSRENEYRLVLHSNIINLESAEYRMLRYDFDSLEGLVFGIRTPPEEKMKIIEKIEALCVKHSRADFRFYQARYDEVSTKIVIDKVPFKLNLE